MAFSLVSAALAAAMSLQGGDPEESPPQLDRVDKAAVERWSETYLVQEGWSPSGWIDTGVLFFVSSTPSDMSKAPLVIDWLRSEHAKGTNQGARSSLARVEVDCRNKRSRNVETFYYSGNNLRGRLLSSGFQPDEKFVDAVEGSIHHTYLQMICRSAR